MASLEERFIAAREQLEECVETAGEQDGAVKRQLGALMDHADDVLDAIQDVLSDVREAPHAAEAAEADARADVGMGEERERERD